MNTIPMAGGDAPRHGTVSALEKAAAAFGEAARRYGEWRRLARGRHQLMSLGDDMLKDIGLGRSEAFREYSKPFWRG